MTARTALVQGWEATVAETARLVGEVGGGSFQLTYVVVNRRLKPGEEPADTDTIRWLATAVFVDDRGEYTTQAGRDVEPGGSHAAGVQWACVGLLKLIGVDVEVVDRTNTTDPRDEPAGAPPDRGGER